MIHGTEPAHTDGAWRMHGDPCRRAGAGREGEQLMMDNYLGIRPDVMVNFITCFQDRYFKIA